MNDLNATYGMFDAINLELSSAFSKLHTDEPVSAKSQDEVALAWLTMIHEWIHFMQFHSTTFGLLVTMNRVRGCKPEPSKIL